MIKNFSVSPRILSHLGEDLIKNESIALLELVKNSYDACADKAKIEFITEKGKLNRLIIKDNGFGMDKNIIENVWLTVGTDNKYKKIERNECGRIPLGEKGIGRLGVHKLGNIIKLTSKKKGSPEVEVLIDWKKLDNIKKIEEFPIELTENDDPVFFTGNKTGTIITIEGFKTEWNKRELREVYRILTALNSPFDNTDDMFKVKVTSNNNKLFENLPDFQDIKESALYFGRCVMEGNRITEFKYNFKPWHTLDKIDAGRKKTELQPQEYYIIDQEKPPNPIELNTEKIGKIEFDIIIFETDNQIFKYVNAEKKSIKDYLRENGGIKVYRDGIRVYNYGERDNDWLGIDIKRVSRVGGRVSNNIIIGSVRINREESGGLKEKTNREGFIENESYNAFANAVNYALALIVKERNIDKQKLTTLYKTHKVAEPVLSDLDEAIEITKEKIKEPEIQEKLLYHLIRVGKQYKEVKEILIKSANAGLNLSVVIHEIEKLIAQLTGSIKRNETEKALDISEMLEKIIRGYSVMIKRSSVKKNELANVVKIALENYEFRFLDHKIEVFTNYKETDLKAYLAESESISALINLLDNAIYWLCYARKKDRKISIYITNQIKGYNSIIVADNGPGFNIPEDIAIEPFITGKPHNIGSGLGLHIANEMMKAMKGKLIFLDKYDLELPYSETDKAIIALCFKTEK